MKKCILAVAAVLLAATLSQAATISWGTGGGTAQYIYYKDSTLATVGWAVELVYIGGDGAQVADNIDGVTGNDAVLFTSSIGTGVGKTQQQPGNLWVTTGNSYTYGSPYKNGDQFIIRVFNNASIGSATWYLDIYKTGTTPFSITVTGNTGAETFGITAAIGKTSGGQTGWNPVPEPTTMALALVGAGAVALRRRFLKK
jgi:hypothetical protein